MPMRPSAACREACGNNIVRYGACLQEEKATSLLMCKCDEGLSRLFAGCSDSFLPETLVSPLCQQRVMSVAERL